MTAISVSDVIIGLLSLVVGLLSFGARELWNNHKEHQKELSALKEELPKTYMPKDDFKAARTEILEAIARIESFTREAIQLAHKRT